MLMYQGFSVCTYLCFRVVKFNSIYSKYLSQSLALLWPACLNYVLSFVSLSIECSQFGLRHTDMVIDVEGNSLSDSVPKECVRGGGGTGLN